MDLDEFILSWLLTYGTDWADSFLTSKNEKLVEWRHEKLRYKRDDPIVHEGGYDIYRSRIKVLRWERVGMTWKTKITEDAVKYVKRKKRTKTNI